MKNKKVIVLILIFTFVFSPILTTKAEAFWPVTDVMNVPKEYGLDAVGWMIANLIIERMAASTVNWINSGFKGSPAFVTDPEAYFKDIGDKVAGQYIFSNPNLNFLCGPIKAKIRLALAQNYVQDDRQWQCTLTQVGKNMEDFMGDFEKGGWDSFFEISQNTTMNPIGAYLKAENELNVQIATRQGIKQTELNWGSGFMSFEVCKGEEGRDEDGTCIGGADIATPGSVISEQLNKSLGSGGDKLSVADEINEIVSALLNKLVSSVVGGIGKGLRSLTKPDPVSGNQIFTQKLTEMGAGSSGNPSAGYTGYFGCVTDPNDPSYVEGAFCDKPNTSVLDIPIYSPECIDNPGLPECQLPDPVLQVQIIPSPCDPAIDPFCTTTP